MSSQEKPQTKKFQKGERTIPTASDKALKYYPAEDEAVPRKVSWSNGERHTYAWSSKHMS